MTIENIDAQSKRKNKKKIALIAGALALVVGGSVGGALVTTSSTSFGNQFHVDSDIAPPDLEDGELEIISTDKFDFTFLGDVDDESTVVTFELRNNHATRTVTVFAGADIVSGEALASILGTEYRLDADDPFLPSGKLNSMASGQFTIAAGATVSVDVRVSNAVAQELIQADLAGTTTEVDFWFDGIYL